ncbi:uncharacterized protein N7483_007335 [Penicillium malachiteum]|uniref:uncharacterized protein n=1 Tax=Penicillium malachiteum TaxID=1324776 RepID=UPI0025490C5F|nr:uncharacterized protein N7483_007335 [Penicillium malachiteum]KAJ5725978.1 hypothetical protein N7483_007335 [Penicillium malachiteum]
MTARVPITVDKFLELSQLYEEKDLVLSVVGCAYLIKAKKNHCGNSAHKDTAEIGKMYLQGLYDILCADSKSSPDGGIEFNQILDELVKYFLCKSKHHDSENVSQAKSQWLKELSTFDKRSQLREKLEIYFPKNADANTTPKPERATANLPQSLPSTPPSQTISDFKPYSQKTPQNQTGDEDIAIRLYIKLRTPLTEEEREPGCLYLIAHTREQNMFKVGITTTPDKRLKQHEKCYGNIKTVAKERIEFVHRIEQVILLELDRERCKLKNQCIKCGTCHGEWVFGSKDKIKKVFDKWVEFARSGESPYDKQGALKKGWPLPPPTAIVTYHPKAAKGSRRKSDMGPKKPLERSLFPEFMEKAPGRHSDVGSSQHSSQYLFDSDRSDMSAINERVASLTVKGENQVRDDAGSELD